MELISILPSESRLWEQVWRLYNESFPEYERRRISSHHRATEDDEFHTHIAIDNGNLLALLFYWTYDNNIYIEHIAVNPQMRGRSIGSNLLRQFIEDNPGKTIILEIDPPVDDISRRRLAFYERIGFVENCFEFRHPSYTKNGHGHELRIMSYPDVLADEQFEKFKEYLAAKILAYID